jgi:hypothetical protein
MDDLILAAIRRRLKISTTDLDGGRRAPLRPADPADIANDERQLGFALPPLLKRIYTEIGNGGFGPGYGLTGLTNGVPDDTGKTAPVLYQQFSEDNAGEPTWRWPKKLLPICHWGCAILSCVDCAAPSFPMRIFDPNMHEADDWADAFFDEADSFDAWIKAWADGADLWQRMYSNDGHAARILLARRPDR